MSEAPIALPPHPGSTPEHCHTHGCKLIPITNDAGDAIIDMDCPECMRETARDNYFKTGGAHHPARRG